MLPLLLIAVLLLSHAEARVTFTYSEVLQETDLTDIRAPFKCDNGCNAYTDFVSNNLWITEYNQQNETYDIVVSFSKMGGQFADVFPEPYILKAGKNYFIEDRGETKPYTFVFYAVDSKAPNLDTPVMIIADKYGNDGNGNERMYTTLSSKSDSVRYNQFVGAFQTGYPRIYSTGFDAVSEKACNPLYQSRSEESVLLSAITVFSPISTVDFGYEGEHNVHVAWNTNGHVSAPGPISSIVYMSPGYHGCAYTRNSYSSPIDSVGEGFMIENAKSLFVSGNYWQVTPAETVQLGVDEIVLDFNGTDSFQYAYPKPFVFAVACNWKRKTPTSSWAVQIDTGTLVEIPFESTSASKMDSTTSAAGLSTIFFSFVVTILAILM